MRRNWSSIAFVTALITPVSLSAGTTKIQDWPQSNFDGGHSGYNPQENTLSVSNVSRLKLKWGLGGNYQIYAAALDGDEVYVQDFNGDASTWELRAINAKSGHVKWTVATNVNGPQPTIAAVNGLVFAQCTAPDSGGTQVGGICAYKETNGKLVWQYVSPCNCVPESGLATALSYDNGAVYFGYGYGTGTGYTNVVLALDAKTGKTDWSYVAGGNNSLAVSTPAISGGKVYVGCGIQGVGLAVCALAESSGSLLWYGGVSSDVRNVSANADGVYALECGTASLVKLKPATGATLWTFGSGDCGGGTNRFPVGISGKFVYYSSDQLYALNAKSGQQAWSVPNPASSPAIANGIVFVEGGTDSNGQTPFASAYDADRGNLLWSSAEGRTYWNWSPMVVNGTFYYGADNTCGSICAYALKKK